MSLTALPVTVSDLTTLQSGIQFFTNTAEATTEAAAINAPGATETVFTYAARLISEQHFAVAGCDGGQRADGRRHDCGWQHHDAKHPDLAVDAVSAGTGRGCSCE